MSDDRLDLPPASSPKFLERVRETLQVMMGTRGDKMYRVVLVKDLEDRNIITLNPLFAQGGPGRHDPIAGVGSAVEPAYVADTAVPMAPTGFSATTLRGSIRVSTDAAGFSAGNGYGRTVIYGVKYAEGEVPPGFGVASVLVEFAGSACTFSAEPASLYRLWAVWVTNDDVASPPSGGGGGLAVAVPQLEDENIASLSFSKLVTGILPATSFAQSATYVAGTTGWKYGGDGFAEMNGLIAKGTTLEGVSATGATGTGDLVFSSSPVLTTPNLGTPSALAGTNITGTATGFTAGDALKLGGVAPAGYAAASHTHDYSAVYAPLVHTHASYVVGPASGLSVSHADAAAALDSGAGVTGTKTTITSITVTNGVVTAWV